MSDLLFRGSLRARRESAMNFCVLPRRITCPQFFSGNNSELRLISRSRVAERFPARPDLNENTAGYAPIRASPTLIEGREDTVGPVRTPPQLWLVRTTACGSTTCPDGQGVRTPT